MSSFGHHHKMFVFEMKNGRRKIAYGETAEDALEILGYRLTPAEMDEICRDKYTIIQQRRLQEYIDNLG